MSPIVNDAANHVEHSVEQHYPCLELMRMIVLSSFVSASSHKELVNASYDAETCAKQVWQ